MEVIFARGLRFSVELGNASVSLTKYLPLSACYTCRVNTTRWRSAFPGKTRARWTVSGLSVFHQKPLSLAERYHRYKAASCNSLGLVNNILVYQKSLKRDINKNGITLAYYSDKQSPGGDCQAPPTKLSVFQKMKQMTKDYWHVLIPVHVITSIGWVAIFYTAVRKYVQTTYQCRSRLPQLINSKIFFSGVDIVQLLEYVNFSEKYVDVVRNSSAGNWAITYALYKIFTPLRYTVTVGS